MKKKILTLALVLSLLVALVIPASAVMALESDVSEGSGTVELIASTIDVTAPGDFALGTLNTGDNELAATDGQVVVFEGNDGFSGYTVTAMDADQLTDPGFMLTGADIPLANELLISDDDGITYELASTGLTYAGAAGGTFPLSFDVNQVIDGTELAGVYTITIEFAGSLQF